MINPLSFPDIPKDRIAQTPAVPRDSARLMIVDRKAGTWRHAAFRDIASVMQPGDVVVVNEAKVFPARLFGRKETGGKVQLLLLAPLGPEKDGMARWASLVSPLPKENTRVIFEGGLEARVVAKREEGEWEVLFSRSPQAEIERLGRMPLPPYIRRPAESDDFDKLDREYYQTVFAREQDEKTKCVAAPTAGLHFTEDLLDRIRAKGVKIAPVRLNVGWGTFKPLQSEDYAQHRMLKEEYLLPEETSRIINQAKAEFHRIWAVGTTAVRVIETGTGPLDRVYPAFGFTNLYIAPGYRFRVVSGLVTNFHLPDHTPLLLTAAFAGTDLLRRAYEEALREGYRFFSYGDAMAIL
jgi:S-adenosylmethionine:tRNA ribosyltransferase-isomerase